jgi:FAD/FMN-containing dehydrogenase
VAHPRDRARSAVHQREARLLGAGVESAQIIERAGERLAARYPDVRPYAFGHVGDGNIHYNVGPEAHGGQPRGVNRIVYDVVAELDGSISAEHGLGQLKRDEIARTRPARAGADAPAEGRARPERADESRKVL